MRWPGPKPKARPYMSPLSLAATMGERRLAVTGSLTAKAARVVVASSDPNPLVSGRGIAQLKEAGIMLRLGLLGAESHILNEAFNKFITTGLPFVTVKIGDDA